MPVCGRCRALKGDWAFTAGKRTCDECRKFNGRYHDKHRAELNAGRSDRSASQLEADPRAYRIRKLLKVVQTRAKQRGVEFAIAVKDLLPAPAICPCLGIDLDYVGNGQGFNGNAPSVDRIDNGRGYVPGNVWVISTRANLIKRDATVDELEKIAAGLRRVGRGEGR
jgi:hypothetical protein